MLTRSRTGIGNRRRWRVGDTLVEVAIATMIVGFAFTALMEFMASATQANRVTTEMSIAVQAARTGWESTRLMPFAVVQGWRVNPPAAVGVPGGFQRVVQVQYLDVSNLASRSPATPTPGVVRVVVQIQRNNATVYTQSWILSDSGGT